ncbi:MFS transporter [Catenulispora subtropica]|uniref:MFS transporter n=1 Tax=Catenulispora subtropica TaxID=450798 RepID=A0ABN2T483_9ACTN
MTTTSVRPGERIPRPHTRRHPLAAFAGFPKAIWVIFTGTVVNRIGFLVGPFLVFFLGSRGVSTDQTPYVLGALGAGNLVGPAVGGWLADRHSRKLTMLAGLLGTAAAQGALFIAPNVATMAVAAIALSATATMVGPAAYATLTDTVAPERRREAFALFGWAVNIGTAMAGVLGGYLAAHGYWMLFALDAGTSLAFAVIVATQLPSDRAARIAERAAAAQAATGSTPGGSGYGVVFRDRLARKLMPLFGIQLFIYSLTESALPLAIRTDGLPASVMGLAAAVNAGLVVALQPLATTYLSRFPRTPVYIFGSILIALGVALTGVAHTTAAYAATVALWSLGEVAVGGIAGALIADLAPSQARGRYQGAFSWTWGVARFLALTLGTTVYTLVGPGFLWWGMLAAGVGAIAGIAALGPAIDRRTAESGS